MSYELIVRALKALPDFKRCVEDVYGERLKEKRRRFLRVIDREKRELPKEDGPTAAQVEYMRSWGGEHGEP